MAQLSFEAPRPATAGTSVRLLRAALPSRTSVVATPAAPPAQAADDTLDTAWQLGWDHARHDLTPPLERLCINPRLHQGFRAGRQHFGRRTQSAGPAVQRWLALRLQALARGIAFESVQLTPAYLERLAASHCPITRERLSSGRQEPNDAVVARARLDAGYAAGNLAMLSRRADTARAAFDAAALRAQVRRAQAQANGPARLDGLTAAQWARLATLASLVTPLPHDEAASLPMPLLPPPRLRLFNPVQALQALVCQAFAHATPSRQLAAIRSALPPAAALRADFDGFIGAYRSAVDQHLRSRPDGVLRWALEDAWDERLVLSRWKRLARGLTPVQCEAVVAAGGGRAVCVLPDALATDGWALATGGRVPGRRAGGSPQPTQVPRGPSAAARALPAALMPPAGSQADGAAAQFALFPGRG